MQQKKRKIIVVFFCSLLVLIMMLYAYKNKKNGNTIGSFKKNQLGNITAISSYEAIIDVTVTTPKTTNYYVLKQFYAAPYHFKQIVQEPQMLENLAITYDGSSLKITNTSLGLNKLYTNYSFLSENNLWLPTCIENYTLKSKNTETEENWILENPLKENPYFTKQILTISKKTGLPVSLQVENNNKTNQIYINYREITLNQTNKNAIVAFQLWEQKEDI